VDLAHPELAPWTSGTTIHWRLVLHADAYGNGTVAGADATFVVP
jgi:hypothetical protein